jgi:hypothetical protein
LLFRPTENRNGQPFVSDVVLCSWTLWYFPAHTSRFVAGCARCVCQQNAEYRVFQKELYNFESV